VALGETAVSATEDGAEPDARTLIHDFRNLLAVIVNYSELIAEEVDDPQAVRADIQEVRLAAERAIAMTDKLPRGDHRIHEAPPPASAT
jgi:hypothetical protein